MGKQQLLTKHLEENGNKWIPMFVPYRRFIDGAGWIKYGYDMVHEMFTPRTVDGDYLYPPWYH